MINMNLASFFYKSIRENNRERWQACHPLPEMCISDRFLLSFAAKEAAIVLVDLAAGDLSHDTIHD